MFVFGHFTQEGLLQPSSRCSHNFWLGIFWTLKAKKTLSEDAKNINYGEKQKDKRNRKKIQYRNKQNKYYIKNKNIDYRKNTEKKHTDMNT